MPIVAAGVTAVVSAIEAWFTARRGVRVEIDKLKFDVQQKLFEQLVEARLATYPALYSLVSDLVKVLNSPNDSDISLNTLLSKVNKWDSDHAILLSPYTSNICYDFRKTLAKAANDPHATHEQYWPELFRKAELLELAVRSDLGIYGIELGPSTEGI